MDPTLKEELKFGLSETVVSLYLNKNSKGLDVKGLKKNLIDMLSLVKIPFQKIQSDKIKSTVISY